MDSLCTSTVAIHFSSIMHEIHLFCKLYTMKAIPRMVEVLQDHISKFISVERRVQSFIASKRLFRFQYFVQPLPPFRKAIVDKRRLCKPHLVIRQMNKHNKYAPNDNHVYVMPLSMTFKLKNKSASDNKFTMNYKCNLFTKPIPNDKMYNIVGVKCCMRP